MRDSIKIGKIKAEKVKSKVFDSAIKLCADITMKNPNTGVLEKKECFFEFDDKYEKYLVAERSDAFVAGLLVTALENNLDIEFENPISERLYYQLTTYFIPMISKYNSKYPLYNISLKGNKDNSIIPNKNKVATVCSGGVDSFYTMIKHGRDYEIESKRLTHIVYSSSGTDETLEEVVIKNYKHNMSHIERIAKECNLELISCYNNLYQFYKKPFKGFTAIYATTFGSVAYALQKLLSTYYISSGDPISEFNLDLSKTHGHDASVFDVFTTGCMNTENLMFYTSGSEYDRIEKENYIANNEQAQKLLVVCAYNNYAKEHEKHMNCSKCPKCLRTMAQFYSLGKLENFKESFDIEEFMNHKAKNLGKMMALNKHTYVNDMKKTAKENNVRIPIISYFYCYFWYKPIKKLRKIFKKSTLARKIYYKFNLDYKLDGYRGPNYSNYKDKIK